MTARLGNAGARRALPLRFLVTSLKIQVMKTIILFLVGFLTVCMCSCQSKLDSIPDYDIPYSDAIKRLPHAPTGVVYVKTTKQSVKIDFSLDKYMASVINYLFTFQIDNEEHTCGNLLDTIPTIGKLVAVYKEQRPFFFLSFSSYYWPCRDGNIIFPKLEYALAQVCFLDNCSSETRKAILKIAVDKQKQSLSQQYITNFQAVRTNMFLMAVILAKEKNVAFIDAVQKNTDLQNVLCVSAGVSLSDNEISDLMRQFAINFLSN